MTLVRTATEQLKLTAEAASDPATRTAMEKQIEAWQKTAARYDSEPETHEGRKELAERAKEAEENRNTFLAKYHAYEIASAAFQIGIVLASAAVITEIIALAWLAGLLGAGGLAVMALGILAPHVLHSLYGRHSGAARGARIHITNHADSAPIPLDLGYDPGPE